MVRDPVKSSDSSSKEANASTEKKRIQTAEGWKRSQMKDKAKTTSKSKKTEAA